MDPLMLVDSHHKINDKNKNNAYKEMYDAQMHDNEASNP